MIDDIFPIPKPQPPEKIYGWRDTQLSIARHYGGLKFRGASYTIDVNDPDQPLVRDDILKAEVKAKKQAAKKTAATGDIFKA